MDKENKKLDIKTFKFEDFQNKIQEGSDRIGFNTYAKHTFEGEDNIDELGSGEEVDTDLIEDAPMSETEDAPDTVEANTDAIDSGDSNGVSTADLEEKLKELLKISKFIKGNDMQNIYNDINKILNNPSYSQYIK